MLTTQMALGKPREAQIKPKGMMWVRGGEIWVGKEGGISVLKTNITLNYLSVMIEGLLHRRSRVLSIICALGFMSSGVLFMH